MTTTAPTPTRRVLVVDDDPHVREIVRYALEREGFSVVEAADGKQALERHASSRPDLVVLDVLMPEMDGLETCRTLRASSRVPVVFLTSKDEEVDRIVGLELGGDDYMTKPFSPRELVARVKAVLRRAQPQEPGAGYADEPRLIEVGRLRVDPSRFEATWDGKLATLTATEFGLLLALARRPGRVFTRAELMERAYREHAVVSERTIDSHVKRLRRKLADVGGDPVETVHGVGYRLGDCLA